MNPYASPVGMSRCPEIRPFRSNPVARVVSRTLRGGDWPARRDSATGALVLRCPRFALAFCWFGMIGVPLIVTVAAWLNPPLPDERWIPWAVSAFFAVFGGIGVLGDENVYVGAGGIEKRGSFRGIRAIRWSDLREVKINQSGTLILISNDDKRVTVSAEMVGVSELPDLLHKHLPHIVWYAVERDLVEYRRFVS